MMQAEQQQQQEEHAEEEQVTEEEEVGRTVQYQTLDTLQEHGIASNDITKLQDAGYHTIESIAHATARKLSEVKGISEAKVTKLKSITRTMVPMDFMTALDALEGRKDMVTLTTGSVELDKLLEGGVETGSIT
eukprot:CAMPEP_0198258022 /NCGR_PEP_ID=MMETSP1447-20131203/7550_1 /TAXON_ID=420782 /ORGANISM="Chaetoceros dichaeta, Strain CCMP1751" /LENGTH=132 /DNA_ID=CAMNT_0043945051 /DNA_START=31 /DNA_END=425 /DNA_ORIENTATION=-